MDTTIVNDKLPSYKGEILPLCTYRSKAGVTVWVGECSDGYVFGSRWFFASRILSVCFRYAPAFSTKEEAIQIAHLQVCKGGKIPAQILENLGRAACKFNHLPGKKNYDLPFML